MYNDAIMIGLFVLSGYIFGHLIGWAARGRHERRQIPQPVRDAERRIELRGLASIRRNDVLCDAEITEDAYGVLESEEIL